MKALQVELSAAFGFARLAHYAILSIAAGSQNWDFDFKHVYCLGRVRWFFGARPRATVPIKVGKLGLFTVFLGCRHRFLGFPLYMKAFSA